ncbi:unnamed protein product [Urochloa humidicola]
MFLHQAAALQDTACALLAAHDDAHPSQSPSLAGLLQDYVLKAVALAAQLGTGGGRLQGCRRNEALSIQRPKLAGRVGAGMVPVDRVFTRLKETLPMTRATPVRTPLQGHDNTMQEVQTALHDMELRAALGEPYTDPSPASPIYRTGGTLFSEEQFVPEATKSPLRSTNMATEVPHSGIAGLFVTPAPPILQQQPLHQHSTTPPHPLTMAPRRRKRRTFDMSKEYLASFTGPVPADILAALTAMFNLDDDDAEDLDVALAAMAGDGIGEAEA